MDGRDVIRHVFTLIFTGYDPSNIGAIGGVPERLTGVRNVKAADVGRFGNSGWNYFEGPAYPS